MVYCQDCKTMNFAGEVYCKKCSGSLYRRRDPKANDEMVVLLSIILGPRKAKKVVTC